MVEDRTIGRDYTFTGDVASGIRAVLDAPTLPHGRVQPFRRSPYNFGGGHQRFGGVASVTGGNRPFYRKSGPRPKSGRPRSRRLAGCIPHQSRPGVLAQPRYDRRSQGLPGVARGFLASWTDDRCRKGKLQQPRFWKSELASVNNSALPSGSLTVGGGALATAITLENARSATDDSPIPLAT